MGVARIIFAHIFFATFGPIFLQHASQDPSYTHAKNQRDRSAAANFLQHFRPTRALCPTYGPLVTAVPVFVWVEELLEEGGKREGQNTPGLCMDVRLRCPADSCVNWAHPTARSDF